MMAPIRNAASCFSIILYLFFIHKKTKTLGVVSAKTYHGPTTRSLYQTNISRNRTFMAPSYFNHSLNDSFGGMSLAIPHKNTESNETTEQYSKNVTFRRYDLSNNSTFRRMSRQQNFAYKYKRKLCDKNSSRKTSKFNESSNFTELNSLLCKHFNYDNDVFKHPTNNNISMKGTINNSSTGDDSSRFISTNVTGALTGFPSSQNESKIFNSKQSSLKKQNDSSKQSVDVVIQSKYIPLENRTNDRKYSIPAYHRHYNMAQNVSNTKNHANKLRKNSNTQTNNHESGLIKVIPLSRKKNTTKNKRPSNRVQSFRDTVLKLNKHFGKTHRIVLDYSQGEENARLLIYLHDALQDDVLSKRSSIEHVRLHDEHIEDNLGEKRMIGAFGINRWSYFGINGDFKRYDIPKENDTEIDTISQVEHEDIETQSNPLKQSPSDGTQNMKHTSKEGTSDTNSERRKSVPPHVDVDDEGIKHDIISKTEVPMTHREGSVIHSKSESKIQKKKKTHSNQIKNPSIQRDEKISDEISKEDYLPPTARNVIKQPVSMDVDTPYVHYIRTPERPRIPARPHIPLNILRKYMKPAKHIPLDKDTEYVHYIRPTEATRRPTQSTKIRRRPSKRITTPPVHKVIDVSGFDNDDDDDDDEDDNIDLHLYQKKSVGKSGLSRKEEALYKEYLNNKQQDQEEQESVNNNLREKKDLHDMIRRRRSETDGDAEIMNMEGRKNKEKQNSISNSIGYKKKRDSKEDDDTEEEDTKDNHSNIEDSDEDDIGKFVKKIAKEINVGKHASELVPQSIEEERGDKRMVPIRALDALYKSHKFPNEPDSKDILDRFDAPTKVGYQYGQLVWGWFIAPLDGEYIFYSACDDACDIYMSPDEGKDHIRKVISQNRWSLHNQWDKYPEEQTSMGIRLAGGRAYYIQAVGAQSGGRDCLSVGVQLPTGVSVKPITRHFLTRSPIGPGGRFRMSPALAAAQKADIQSSLLGYSPAGSWGLTQEAPGASFGVGDAINSRGIGVGDTNNARVVDQLTPTLSGTSSNNAINGITPSSADPIVLYTPGVNPAGIPLHVSGGTRDGGSNDIPDVAPNAVSENIRAGLLSTGLAPNPINIKGSFRDGAPNFSGSQTSEADKELISSIAKLGDTVSGLAAKVADKEKAMERAKQTAMVGATLSKLDKAIDAISSKMGAQNGLNGMNGNAAMNGGQGSSIVPANDVVPSGLTPNGVLSSLLGNGGLGNNIGGLAGGAGAGLNSIITQPVNGITSSSIGNFGLNNGGIGAGIPSATGGIGNIGLISGLNGIGNIDRGTGSTNGNAKLSTTSPEISKLESNVGGLAERVNAITEKIEKGRNNESPDYTTQAKINNELHDMGLAIGKLAGKVESIKSQNNNNDLDSVLDNIKNSKSESDITKLLGYLQRKETRSPLQQVANGYTQSVNAVSNPPPPPDSGTAAAILASATVNQALNAIKTAAQATGLSGTALGTAITSKESAGPDASTRQLIELIKSAAKPDKPDKVDKHDDDGQISSTGGDPAKIKLTLHGTKEEARNDEVRVGKMRNVTANSEAEVNKMMNSKEEKPVDTTLPIKIINSAPGTTMEPTAVDKFPGGIGLSLNENERPSRPSSGNSIKVTMQGPAMKNIDNGMNGLLNNNLGSKPLGYRIGLNGLGNLKPNLEYHDWSNEGLDGLGALDRVDDFEKFNSLKKYHNSPLSDSDMNNLVDYLSNANIPPRINSMDYTPSSPVENPIFDQSPITGIGRSVLMSYRNINDPAKSLKNHHIDSDEDFFRTLYQSSTKNTLQQVPLNKDDSLNIQSVSSSQLEPLLRNLNLDNSQTKIPLNQGSVTALSDNTDALINRPSLLSSNLLDLLSESNGMNHISPASSSNHLPPNFANLLVNSHADDLLKSLEGTSNPMNEDAGLNLPLPSSNTPSTDILDLLANFKTKSLASNRHSVFHYAKNHSTSDSGLLKRNNLFATSHRKNKVHQEDTKSHSKRRANSLPSTKRNFVPNTKAVNASSSGSQAKGFVNESIVQAKRDRLNHMGNTGIGKHKNLEKNLLHFKLNETGGEETSYKRNGVDHSDLMKMIVEDKSPQSNLDKILGIDWVKKDGSFANATVNKTESKEGLTVKQDDAQHQPATDAPPPVPVFMSDESRGGMMSTPNIKTTQNDKQKKDDEDKQKKDDRNDNSFQESLTKKLLDAVLAEKKGNKEEEAKKQIGRIYPIADIESSTKLNRAQSTHSKLHKSFQNEITETLLENIIQAKTEESNRNENEISNANTGGLMDAAYSADQTGPESLMDTAYAAGFHSGLQDGGSSSPENAAISDRLNKLTSMVSMLAAQRGEGNSYIDGCGSNFCSNAKITPGLYFDYDYNSIVAAIDDNEIFSTTTTPAPSSNTLTSQLNGLGEGIGLLIKEIRDLKVQQVNKAQSNKLKERRKVEAWLMATAIDKALNSIKEAASAVGIANAPFNMYGRLSPIPMPYPANIPSTYNKGYNPLIGNGVEYFNVINGGANRFIGDNAYLQGNEFTRPNIVRNAALLDAERAFAARINQENRLTPVQPVIPQMNFLSNHQTNTIGDQLNEIVSVLGPKASAHFLDGMSAGMNQATKQYIDRERLAATLNLFNGGSLADKLGKNDNGKSKATRSLYSIPESKRAHVITIDENELSKALEENIYPREKEDLRMQQEIVQPDNDGDYVSDIRTGTHVDVMKWLQPLLVKASKRYQNDESINENILDKESRLKTEEQSMSAIRKDMVSLNKGLKPDEPGVTLEIFWDIDGIEDGYIEGVYKSKKFPNKPDKRDVRFNFDSSEIQSDSFAQRMYGWFLPPLTGGYIFYTSCDDVCDLFLSSGADPSVKLKLVSQKQWSDHNQFDKYPLMQSSTIVRLEKGKSYYIEAVESNMDGPNHLSVGVQLPNGLMLRPIPGEFLNRIPFMEKEDENGRNKLGIDDIASLVRGAISDASVKSSAKGTLQANKSDNKIAEKIASTVAASIGGSAILHDFQQNNDLQRKLIADSAQPSVPPQDASTTENDTMAMIEKISKELSGQNSEKGDNQENATVSKRILNDLSILKSEISMQKSKSINKPIVNNSIINSNIKLSAYKIPEIDNRDDGSNKYEGNIGAAFLPGSKISGTLSNHRDYDDGKFTHSAVLIPSHKNLLQYTTLPSNNHHYTDTTKNTIPTKDSLIQALIENYKGKILKEEKKSHQSRRKNNINSTGITVVNESKQHHLTIAEIKKKQEELLRSNVKNIQDDHGERKIVNKKYTNSDEVLKDVFMKLNKRTHINSVNNTAPRSNNTIVPEVSQSEHRDKKTFISKMYSNSDKVLKDVFMKHNEGTHINLVNISTPRSKLSPSRKLHNNSLTLNKKDQKGSYSNYTHVISDVNYYPNTSGNRKSEIFKPESRRSKVKVSDMMATHIQKLNASMKYTNHKKKKGKNQKKNNIQMSNKHHADKSINRKKKKKNSPIKNSKFVNIGGWNYFEPPSDDTSTVAVRKSFIAHRTDSDELPDNDIEKLDDDDEEEEDGEEKITKQNSTTRSIIGGEDPWGEPIDPIDPISLPPEPLVELESSKNDTTNYTSTNQQKESYSEFIFDGELENGTKMNLESLINKSNSISNNTINLFEGDSNMTASPEENLTGDTKATIANVTAPLHTELKNDTSSHLSNHSNANESSNETSCVRLDLPNDQKNLSLNNLQKNCTPSALNTTETNHLNDTTSTNEYNKSTCESCNIHTLSKNDSQGIKRDSSTNSSTNNTLNEKSDSSSERLSTNETFKDASTQNNTKLGNSTENVDTNLPPLNGTKINHTHDSKENISSENALNPSSNSSEKGVDLHAFFDLPDKLFPQLMKYNSDVINGVGKNESAPSLNTNSTINNNSNSDITDDSYRKHLNLSFSEHDDDHHGKNESEPSKDVHAIDLSDNGITNGSYRKHASLSFLEHHDDRLSVMNKSEDRDLSFLDDLIDSDESLLTKEIHSNKSRVENTEVQVRNHTVEEKTASGLGNHTHSLNDTVEQSSNMSKVPDENTNDNHLNSSYIDHSNKNDSKTSELEADEIIQNFPIPLSTKDDTASSSVSPFTHVHNKEDDDHLLKPSDSNQLPTFKLFNSTIKKKVSLNRLQQQLSLLKMKKRSDDYDNSTTSFPSKHRRHLVHHKQNQTKDVNNVNIENNHDTKRDQLPNEDKMARKRTITQSQKLQIANAAMKVALPVIVKGLIQKAITRRQNLKLRQRMYARLLPHSINQNLNNIQSYIPLQTPILTSRQINPIPYVNLLAPALPAPIGPPLALPYAAPYVYEKKAPSELSMQLLKNILVRKFIEDDQNAPPSILHQMTYPKQFGGTLQQLYTLPDRLQQQLAEYESNRLFNKLLPQQTNQPSIKQLSTSSDISRSVPTANIPTRKRNVTILKRSPTKKATDATTISRSTNSRINDKEKKHKSDSMSKFIAPSLYGTTNPKRRHSFDAKKSITENEITNRGVTKKAENGLVLIPFGTVGYAKEPKQNLN